MKKDYGYGVIVALAMVFAFSCGTPDGYVISGKIDTEDSDGHKIILMTEDSAVADSAIVQNGRFTFRGRVNGVLRAALTIGDDMLQFILVNDKIYVEVSHDDWSGSAVRYSKSKAADHVDKYFEENKTLFYEPYKQLLSSETENLPREEQNAVQQRKDSLVYSYIGSLIEEYEKSVNREGLSVIVGDLVGLFGTKEHPEKIKELYALMPENERNSYIDRRIQDFFHQSEHIAIGQPVDFDFTDSNGIAGKVSDYNGKLVLIEFWATWCGPCLSQFPAMEKISAHADKIKIITVSIDEDIDRWQAKVPELDASWVNIHYRQDVDLKKHFFVSGVPDNLLLSQDGKILRKKNNIADILAILE